MSMDTEPVGSTTSRSPEPAGDVHRTHGRAAARVRTESSRMRERLATVAGVRSGEGHHGRGPHGPHDPDPSHGRFVAALLVTVVVALCAVAAVNWWLDPTGVTGRTTRFSSVANAGVRQAKLDLMDRLAAPPAILVLGSSRTMKLDPAIIQRTSGRTAFNAGVSGATNSDMLLYAQYAQGIWGDRAFPHLVIGVMTDTFRDVGGANAGLDPRFRDLLPKDEAPEPSALSTIGSLVQMQTLRASAHSSMREVREDGPGVFLRPVVDGEDAQPTQPVARNRRDNRVENFDARGMQLYDVADPALPLEQRVDTQMANYIPRSYETGGAYDGADPRNTEAFVRLIKLANRHGDEPTVWITPFQPEAEAKLPAAYEERDEEVRRTLEQLEARPDLRFTVRDFADIEEFDGAPADFHDGIHMTPANTARVVRKLSQLGDLAPRRARS